MIALVAVMSTGCAEEAEVRNPYAVEFAEARSEATTEVARTILEDDVITAAEYELVQEASVQCMRDRGFGVRIDDEGGVTIEEEGWTEDTPTAESDAISAQIDAVRDECWAKFDMGVLDLYWEVRWNPTNEDMLQSIADCLVRGGHRDKGYDKEAYTEEVSRYSVTLESAPDGSTIEVEGDLSGQPLPPEMAACQEDPER